MANKASDKEHKTRFYIARYHGSGSGETLWAPMVGRQYKTKAGAEKAFARLEEQWDEAARQGRIHPTHEGKFKKNHLLVEVPGGETFRAVINGMPGYRAIGLGSSRG